MFELSFIYFQWCGYGLYKDFVSNVRSDIFHVLYILFSEMKYIGKDRKYVYGFSKKIY